MTSTTSSMYQFFEKKPVIFFDQTRKIIDRPMSNFHHHVLKVSFCSLTILYVLKESCFVWKKNLLQSDRSTRSWVVWFKWWLITMVRLHWLLHVNNEREGINIVIYFWSIKDINSRPRVWQQNKYTDQQLPKSTSERRRGVWMASCLLVKLLLLLLLEVVGVIFLWLDAAGIYPITGMALLDGVVVNGKEHARTSN